MKVTARDIAALVKDTQVEMMRKRSAEPKESLIDALILDEMQKMTSLLEGERRADRRHVRGLDEPRSERVRRHLELGRRAASQTQRRAARRRPVRRRTRASGGPTPPPGEIESLEQMLEPDRTGVHKKDERQPPWALIIVLMVLLAAGAAVAVVFMMS